MSFNEIFFDFDTSKAILLNDKSIYYVIDHSLRYTQVLVVINDIFSFDINGICLIN